MSTCACMSATSRCETSPAPWNSAVAASGSSVWTWTFSVAASPTTSTESPICFERRDPADGIEPLPGDGEVRAEAIRRGVVLRVAHPRRRLHGDARRLAAAQGRDHARDDDGQRVPAGVDDAALAQHGEQFRAAAHGLLAGVQRALEHVGDDGVLDLGIALGAQPRVAHVGEIAGDARRHVAQHGEDRALGRPAHRRVRALRRTRHRGADEDRVDELAGPADELLGGAADELREDHAAVAARAEQRRARDRLDDLVAADLVDQTVATSERYRWRGGRARRARPAASRPCCRPCRRRRQGRRSGR